MSASTARKNKHRKRSNKDLNIAILKTALTNNIIARKGKKLLRMKHDPRNNPEAMKDIIEDPNAVYGFSPSPDSPRLGPYAQYDWSDPRVVGQARKERKTYHASILTMLIIIGRMNTEGASDEEIARAVSGERNQIRIRSYYNDPIGLARLRESNMRTYGHEDGPTPDQLYEKYGSWRKVTQKAFSLNMGMDACCNLYDEYYQLYTELGLVDAEVGFEKAA